MKGFTDAGFKTRVETIANFHDDYGLKGGDDKTESSEEDGSEEDGTSTEHEDHDDL